MKFLPSLVLLSLPLLASAQEADSLVSTELEGVVVTGQFEPQSASRSVYRVRTIPVETLRARGAIKLQDVLNTELNIRGNYYKVKFTALTTSSERGKPQVEFALVKAGT